MAVDRFYALRYTKGHWARKFVALDIGGTYSSGGYPYPCELFRGAWVETEPSKLITYRDKYPEDSFELVCVVVSLEEPVEDEMNVHCLDVED